MVTPAMQQPPVIYGPNGEVARWNGSEYVVEASAPAASAGGYSIVPMTTPAEQRAVEDQQFQREDRLYQRERNAITDERAAAREERAIAAAERQAEQLTEGQSKSLQYGTMMRGAERDYQAAIRNGYDPSSLRNTLANVAGVIPFDGDYFGRLIRDDASDQGRQAELRWAEANLRQLTGAAATNPEIARIAAINFDRGNDELAEQRYRSRAETYAATRLAAGAARDRLPEDYPSELYTAPLDDNGLPVYTGPVGENLEPAAPVAVGPGASPDDPFDFTTASREEVIAAIQRGGWFRQGPNGEPYQLPPQDPQFGAEEGDQMVAPGVAVRPQASGAGFLMGQQALQRSALEQFPLGDEIAAAAIGAISPNLGYSDVRRAQRGLAEFDRENYAVERNAGGLAGATALLATPFGAPINVTRGATLAGRVANRAAGGAVAGGVYAVGQGEGNALERVPRALAGAGIGAVAGPAAPVAANALVRGAAPLVRGVQALNRAIARPVVNALGEAAPVALREAVAPNPLAAGIDRFAARSPQNPDLMRSNVAQFRGQSVEPTFADAVNDGGRGTLRALATRQTPARQAAREFAEGRAAGLQDRISTQARRTLSDDPRQPAQIRQEITTRRNAEADQAFGAVRGQPLQPERGVIEALRAPALRPAIEEAATAALNRGDSETANLLRQLTDGALDNPNGVQITVGMADRLSRSLNGRAEAFQRAGNNDQAAAYFALAERLRGSARQQVPAYGEALESYATDSRLAQATELGEQFLSMEADQFAAAVARLSPDEQQIARAAARRAVERQAGTQGQAPGVAQRLANSREQVARTQALTGNAQPVQDAMRTELQALRNAQGISPAQGSPTSMNAQDAMNAAGVVGAAATGNLPALASRALNAVRSRGFSDAEAEAIVSAAIDPAQTDRLITMLAERMSRREARNLARAIRFQLTTTGPQSGQGR